MIYIIFHFCNVRVTYVVGDIRTILLRRRARLQFKPLVVGWGGWWSTKCGKSLGANKSTREPR